MVPARMPAGELGVPWPRRSRWVLDGYFPAAGTARYHGLVTPAWVRAVRAFKEGGSPAVRPPAYGGERLVVLEVSWAQGAAAADFRAGHVPGALHLDTDDLEDGYPTWKLRPVAELQAVIGRLGITPTTTVVIYGRQVIAAARAWWALMYAGVADVRLMDGGFAAWTAAGFPGEVEPRAVVPVAFTAAPRDAFIATTAHVRERLSDGRAWLADARSEAEFAGAVSGYDYLDRTGRIPTAVHVGNADDSAQLYMNADGTLRKPEEIATIWERAGLHSTAGASGHGSTSERGRTAAQLDHEVIFSCGSGWRSSLAFFYAWLLGYQNIRNYSDGWCGWSTRYVKDESSAGRTPGWRQEPTGNPVVDRG